MSPILAMLRDRERAQRGSVLSGVLIITAFLAIIAGALMTELSTNFLLSNDLVNRVGNEATVRSAMELAMDQLQNTQLNQACPSPTPINLNNRTAVVSYLSCAPVVDAMSPQFRRIAYSDPFNVDGTHAQLAGLNDYIVADSGGTLFDYPFGALSPRWSLALGGSVTASVLVMADPINSAQFLDLIPLQGPSCAPSTYCLSAAADDGSSNSPSSRCTMASGALLAEPAAGIAFPRFAFTADADGVVNAIDLTTSSGSCDVESNSTVSGAAAGRVVVVPCSGCGRTTDEIYVLTNTNGSSQLTHLTYNSQQGLNAAGSPLSLPWDNASGMALEQTGLPAKLAISFASGGVAIVGIDSNAKMSLAASTLMPDGAAIQDAPYWCHCPGGANLIGVGTQGGTLYLLDTGLNITASYTAGTAINTTPGVDGAGNWYFGADDGYVYEVQLPAGQSVMTLARRYGPIGQVGSAVQVGRCVLASDGAGGICIYVGSLDNSAYLVSLDARDAVMSACLSTSPPTCSGDNPRLWTRVEVGNAVNPQTVRIQGWSYYSP